MKTIYLKAEIVDENISGTQTGIKIGDESFAYYLNKEDLEQAQVLAVEELLEKDWGKERLTISVENQGQGTVFVDSSNTRKPKETQIQELTSLVRGKERTLEDEALEFIESDVENYRLLASALGTAKVMAKFAEQLLKKEKPTRPFYNEGDGGLP